MTLSKLQGLLDLPNDENDNDDDFSDNNMESKAPKQKPG